MGFGVWFVISRYRRGFEVAITSDGLIVRLPGFNDDLIPWQNIGGSSVKETPEGTPQIAAVFFEDKQKNVNVGGACNVFPKRADAKCFVGQVTDRLSAASEAEA